MEIVMRVSYDKDGDILDFTLGEFRPSVMIPSDAPDDVWLRQDAETGEMVGGMILNFSKHFPTGGETITFPISVGALLKAPANG